ncbi:MAG: hypothetical protein ACE5JO_00720 [Candidatus Binatia bacterium]
MRATVKSNQGIAMVMVIMTMVILLSLTGAGLLLSGLNLKTASNLKTGGGAIHAADAGLQHGLAVIPSGDQFDSLLTGSVTGFPCSGTCDGVNIKPTLTGSLSGYSYSVVAEDDADGGTPTAATDDTNQIVMLTSTASGPNSSVRRVKAYIGRSTGGFVPPGAVYIPGDPLSDSDFKTTGGIFVTGDDTNYTDSDSNGRADSTSAGPESSILGVGAGDQAIVDEFIAELSSAEKARIQGYGYDGSTTPATPSVAVPATGTSLDVSQLATDLVNQIPVTDPCPPRCPNGLSWNATACPSTSPCTLGTDAAPQITYIKEGTQHIHFDGYVYGSGILIVEGKAHFYRDFEFHGLVISLAPGALSDGTVEENLKLKFKNDARIFGGLLLGPNQEKLKFDLKNQAAIHYSSQGLSLADQVGSCCLPQPARIIAWHEVLE